MCFLGLSGANVCMFYDTARGVAKKKWGTGDDENGKWGTWIGHGGTEGHGEKRGIEMVARHHRIRGTRERPSRQRGNGTAWRGRGLLAVQYSALCV